MGIYFGTDGVRGVANTELTAGLAYRLGRTGGYYLTQNNEKPKILVGRDPRISGHMLEGALVSGLLSIGAEVMRLGVISTPGVAFLTKAMSAQAGVMISASHNPVEDNGIKFFGADGFKLSAEQEKDIESWLEQTDELPRPTGGDLGIVSDYFEGRQKYMQFLKQSISEDDFEGMRVALDCAHGATSPFASHVFADLEADICTMGASPNGVNINDGVGSTQPEALMDFVVEKKADVGLAFDGDGDRLIAVDEEGQRIDGDQIMYICAKYMKQEERLKYDTVVSTIMSNLGFYKALEAEEIAYVQTPVGDRNVMTQMREGGYVLGGEQSGHIIFLDQTTTGDGMLSALQLVNIMKATEKPLSELAAEVEKYPQYLVNVKVADKNQVTANEAVSAEMARIEEEMGDEGRLLVRPSGTEPLVRVMAEAETEALCHDYVDRLVRVIENEQGA